MAIGCAVGSGWAAAERAAGRHHLPAGYVRFVCFFASHFDGLVIGEFRDLVVVKF